MTKLSKLQLSLLADADRRDDGGLTRPAGMGMRSAIAVKTAATLIEERLIREVRTKSDMPVWREDEEGKKFSLTILKAGRAALQATSGQGEAKRDAVADAQRVPEPVAGPKLGRPGSKRALIVDLLQRPGGVTIKDLTEATGWLPHTTRAALTGLRKIGLVIDRQRGDETRGSVYRLAGKTNVAS